jgi:hypothetical protein
MTRAQYDDLQVKNNVDTCTKYGNDDIYVDRLCQEKLWKQAGCTKPYPMNYLDEQLTKKSSLMGKFASFFTSPWNTPTKVSCSGLPCDNFKDTDTKVPPDCLAQLWKDAKCVAPMPQQYIPNTQSYIITQNTPISTLKGDINNYSTRDTEEDRKACYGLSRTEYNKKFNIDPCANIKDTDTNIDQLCYNKLWADAKCTTPAPVMSDSLKKLNFSDVKKDINAFATRDTVEARKGCYDKTQQQYNTDNNIKDACIAFPNDSDPITSLLCYQQIWKNAGCTTNSPYDLNTKW